VQISVHFEEDILGHFFGGAALARDAQSDAEHHRLVLLENLFQGAP
jgi:hypothetical protein